MYFSIAVSYYNVFRLWMLHSTRFPRHVARFITVLPCIGTHSTSSRYYQQKIVKICRQKAGIIARRTHICWHQMRNRLLNLNNCCAAYDCADIQCSHQTSKSGFYTFQSPSDRSKTIRAFCDLVSDGGGWTVRINTGLHQGSDVKHPINTRTSCYQHGVRGSWFPTTSMA